MGGSRSPCVPPIEILGQFTLHCLDQIDGNDRLVIAGVAHAPMIELPKVEPIFQDVGERDIGQGYIADDFARGKLPESCPVASLPQLALQGRLRAEFEIALEDEPDEDRLSLATNSLRVSTR